MMKTVNQLFSEIEILKRKIAELGSPINNNEVWSVQQLLQVTCGQLLLCFQESALEKGIERDLWNVGFRTTITILQTQTKNSKKGDTEARDVLNWFLNSASGFYLQLLNQISSANSLDLVFRRKDSVYGLIGGGLSTVPGIKTKENVTKNALYLCQYCLIHLGDLARYRHQAKQAETFYRHAVTVAATSGHPYNQLALLEAGRGNKLASVFLYIRALCVPAPFPGAPSNLIQTLTKVLGSKTSAGNELSTKDESKVETLVRMTKDEYISLFLHFHSCLFLKGDLEGSKEDLPRLSSALSMLAATTTLTRSSLVQMFATNVFALYYFSGKFTIKAGEENMAKKDEEKFVEPKECEGATDLIEDLMVAMLAALLLPIHTMKEPEVVMTYPALPAIRLAFEWILLEDKLSSVALKKKQQIWPGLCSLVNFLQKPLANFNCGDGTETPLPEDRDLHGFQPLSKMLNKYKFKEMGERLTPDKCSLIRAKRLTDLATLFSEQNIDGGTVIRKNMIDGQLLKFEAQSNQNPSVEEIVDLERLTLQPLIKPAIPSFGKKKEKVGILKPQGSLERSKESKEVFPKENRPGPICNKQNIRDSAKVKQERKIKISPGDKRIPITGSNTTILVSGDNSATCGTAESVSNVKLRTRTNVALQAILKRNSSNPETKQVTFQTPSPAISPNPSDASNGSQRSQLSSPPPAGNKWGKTPSNLLSVANINPSKFTNYGGLDYQNLSPQANPAFPPNAAFNAALNPSRPENPYNVFRPQQNNATGGMLPPNKNPEFGPISQHMIRQAPPSHPSFQPPIQSSKQTLFQSNSISNYPSEPLPFQNSALQMPPLYTNNPKSNLWDKGSMTGPKGDIIMGGLQNNPTPPQPERSLMQLPYKDMNPNYNHFQGPSPFQQTSFQPPQRNFPFPNQEFENRNPRTGSVQPPNTGNIFQDSSFSNQPSGNSNIPSHMASLFTQRNNLGSSSSGTSNQLGNLSSGGISQGPNINPVCTLGQATSLNHHNNLGSTGSMNLGSISHLSVGQGNSGQNNMSNNLGGNPGLNLRSNLVSGNDIMGSVSNIGQRNQSNDFIQEGPPYSWWDKEPSNTSMYLSQLINRPPPSYQTTAPTTIDTSIPPPSNDGSSYSGMVPSSMGGHSVTTQSFGPEHQFSQECGNLSARSSNTYSLFGPLGGSEPSGGQAAPSLHMLPSQTQQSVHQSLWSGPSPLQRLLEQKKYASNK